MASLPLNIFLGVSLVACYTDVRRRRVPNLLTYGATAAIVVSTMPHGFVATLASLGSAIVVVFVGSVIFGLGWLGGGDVKLLAAGAAAIGFPAFLIVLLYVAVVGGVIAVIYGLREGRLRAVVTNVAMSAAAGVNVTPAPHSRRIPYALAICAGTFCYVASESFAPWFRFVH